MIENGAILGIGNILQQDDGIGITVLKYVEAHFEFPTEVELIDGGTTGTGLDTSINGKKWLIVIDALNTAGNPGEVKLLKEEAFINRPSAIRLSPHQVGFLDLIQLMRIEGTGPEHVDLIGIIPKTTDFGTRLSPEVADSMDQVLEELLQWLKTKNVTPKRLPAPKPPDYWWHEK